MDRALQRTVHCIILVVHVVFCTILLLEVQIHPPNMTKNYNSYFFSSKSTHNAYIHVQFVVYFANGVVINVANDVAKMCKKSKNSVFILLS